MKFPQKSRSTAGVLEDEAQTKEDLLLTPAFPVFPVLLFEAETVHEPCTSRW